MLKVCTSLDYINIVSNGVVFGSDFKKIPRDYFAAILDVMIYLSKKEVECLFYLNYNNAKEYVITVPTQKVSKYRIKTDLDSLNHREVELLTGEPIKFGLTRLGSIHSHHIFKSDFSIEDDLSDFKNPPGLHLLVGEFPTLAIKASFAMSKTRYSINPCNVIEYSDTHIYEAFKAEKMYNAIKQQIIIHR